MKRDKYSTEEWLTLIERYYDALTTPQEEELLKKFLGILFLAAFLFAIEGFLYGKILSMPMKLNKINGYMKSYVFI